MKLTILSPRLRHRITVQSLEVQQDSETGAQIEGWVDFIVNEPAEILALSGREFIAADAKQAGITHRLTVRKNLPIIASMRAIDQDGLIYNIRAVLPDQTLRRHLTLMCESGITDGN